MLNCFYLLTTEEYGEVLLETSKYQYFIPIDRNFTFNMDHFNNGVKIQRFSTTWFNILQDLVNYWRNHELTPRISSFSVGNYVEAALDQGGIELLSKEEHSRILELLLQLPFFKGPERSLVKKLLDKSIKDFKFNYTFKDAEVSFHRIKNSYIETLNSLDSRLTKLCEKDKDFKELVSILCEEFPKHSLEDQLQKESFLYLSNMICPKQNREWHVQGNWKNLRLQILEYITDENFTLYLSESGERFYQDLYSISCKDFEGFYLVNKNQTFKVLLHFLMYKAIRNHSDRNFVEFKAKEHLKFLRKTFQEVSSKNVT